MQLLIFAHKNEATAFFHYHQFKETTLTDLYFDGSHYLLITGEGLWDCLSKTILAINFICINSTIPVQKIINFGVAGSLRDGIKKKSIFRVRTSYAALNYAEPEFQSYSSLESESQFSHLPQVDCLSSLKRHTSLEEKLTLAPFASLIDRELWSVAKAAKCFDLAWEGLKIVSDEVQENNFCDQVQSHAHEYSSELYTTWINKQEIIKQKTSDSDFQIFLNALQVENLYLTFSGRNQVQDLMTRILLQENISLKKFMEEIPFDLWKKERPKDKSHSLIQWLKLRLTPQLGKYSTAVIKWLKIWHNSKLHLSLRTTEDLEGLEVKFKSYNTQDWYEVINHLKQIPREELDSILLGKF